MVRSTKQFPDTNPAVNILTSSSTLSSDNLPFTNDPGLFEDDYTNSTNDDNQYLVNENGKASDMNAETETDKKSGADTLGTDKLLPRTTGEVDRKEPRIEKDVKHDISGRAGKVVNLKRVINIDRQLHFTDSELSSIIDKTNISKTLKQNKDNNRTHKNSKSSGNQTDSDNLILQNDNKTSSSEEGNPLISNWQREYTTSTSQENGIQKIDTLTPRKIISISSTISNIPNIKPNKNFTKEDIFNSNPNSYNDIKDIEQYGPAKETPLASTPDIITNSESDEKDKFESEKQKDLKKPIAENLVKIKSQIAKSNTLSSLKISTDNPAAIAASIQALINKDAYILPHRKSTLKKSPTLDSLNRDTEEVYSESESMSYVDNGRSSMQCERGESEYELSTVPSLSSVCEGCVKRYRSEERLRGEHECFRNPKGPPEWKNITGFNLYVLTKKVRMRFLQ